MVLICSNPDCKESPDKVTSLNKIKTKGGYYELCNQCAGLYFQGKLAGHNIPVSTENQIPEVFVISRDKGNAPQQVEELQKHISPVSNPAEVPHPDNPKKKFKLEDLYEQFLKDEQVRIDGLFSSLSANEAYAKLEERLALIESITFESKTRASALHRKKRELDAASGKNRWDKERRGEVKGNLSNPKDNPLLSASQKTHKAKLSKLETVVKSMINDLDMSDDQIIDMCTVKNFKGAEVREAIQKFRG